jgi:hypothetical protein
VGSDRQEQDLIVAIDTQLNAANIVTTTTTTTL